MVLAAGTHFLNKQFAFMIPGSFFFVLKVTTNQQLVRRRRLNRTKTPTSSMFSFSCTINKNEDDHVAEYTPDGAYHVAEHTSGGADHVAEHASDGG